jgi:hypothetical protein
MECIHSNPGVLSKSELCNGQSIPGTMTIACSTESISSEGRVIGNGIAASPKNVTAI